MPMGIVRSSIATVALGILVTAMPGISFGADPLVAGVKAFEQGKFSQAIALMTSVFDDKNRTRADAATALYYRGKAQLSLDRSAAALSDLKAALWLNELSATNREDAKRLQAGILKAAGIDPGPAAGEPARRAAHTPPPTATRQPPAPWSTTRQRPPSTPPQATAKTWAAPAETVASRELPPAVRIIPAPIPAPVPAPVAASKPAISASLPTPEPATPKQARTATPWLNRTVPAAPIVTGAIPKSEQQPAAAKIPEPVRPAAFQVEAERPAATVPKRTVVAPTPATTFSAPKRSAEPPPSTPAPPATVTTAAVPSQAQTSGQASATEPATSPGLPSVSSLTGWLDMPSPVDADLAEAKHLQAQRMERIKLHNQMMRQSIEAERATAARPSGSNGSN
ncbi:MAG: hypothetical protein RLZ98_2722 [Pseudomonadota bacterium]